MSATRFEARPTSERLALVESHLEEQDDKLDKVVSSVEGLRSDFTELRIELAKRRTDPPPKSDGLVLPRWLVVAVLALLPGLGAGCVELVKLLLGK
jgi:sensor domain CHASE-containing protein